MSKWNMAKKLRIIFGDQLTMGLAGLSAAAGKDDQILMMEVHDEASYVAHHKQKLVFFFSAMRHFANELVDKGYKVHYIKLTSVNSKGSFTETLQHFLKNRSFSEILITEPSEYRVFDEVMQWRASLKIPVNIIEDNRFFCSRAQFKAWAANKQQLLMENFYRYLRKQTGILMTRNGKPLKGQWNFDKQNRSKVPSDLAIPEVMRHPVDDITAEVIKLVEKRFPGNPGIAKNFNYAVSRRGAKKSLSQFVKARLANFGDYQDAMKAGEYTLFHSVISQYINVGLLLPDEVCRIAEDAYNKGSILINAAEGFIRQILGWREFIRGIYWLKMPQYQSLNFLTAKRQLPDFYWSAKTNMQCMQHVIQQSLDMAQSHHIQRLMITGNFALLTGIKPAEICAWYLAIYVDALEWVELPNTLGMALFADGGVVGTKPYAASGNYINKMSSFCKNCYYDVRKKTGDRACPFNYLYWDFLERNKDKLTQNHRLTFAYKGLAAKSPAEKDAIKASAKRFLRRLNESTD